jgi:hypothetical protein
MALDVLLEAVGAGGIAGVAADPVWGNIVRAATGLWFGTWAGIILGAAIGRPEAARAAGATPVSVSGQRTRDLPGMPAEGRSAS